MKVKTYILTRVVRLDIALAIDEILYEVPNLLRWVVSNFLLIMENDMKKPADFQGKNEIDNMNRNGQIGQSEQEGETPLSESLTNLPKVVSKLMNIHTEEKDKQLTLFGSLVFLGGLLTNVSTKYSKSTLYPNLYFYAVGKAGAGKGALTMLRRLADPFKAEQAKYEKVLKMKDQMPATIQKMLDSVEPSRNWVIPANNSSAGFLQMLKDNEGEGILFETEGDTITNMLRTEYGNYSDMLRKAFHHEPITQYRKGDRELIELLSPRLSVCLSSTPRQLFRFIPDTENGLWSRFMFFVVESDPEFKDMFCYTDESDPEEVIAEVGETMIAYHKRLMSGDPIEFRLTLEQRQKFNDYFSLQKSVVVNFISPNLDASVHRLACIFLRIAMILEVLGALDQEQEIPTVLECGADTFSNTMRLVDRLLLSLRDVHEMMPRKELNGLPENKLGFYTALPDGKFMVKDVLQLGEMYQLSEKGIRRFVGDKALFKRMKHGVYCKQAA